MRRNYQKHTNPNPLQRWLLTRFHTCVAALVEEADSRGSRSGILDVGCGEGFVADFLYRRGFKAPIVGIDADRQSLGMARQAGTALVEGSATALPFADEAFPLVLCLEVLEHLDEPNLALGELRRVSSRCIIASVPNQPFFSAANFLRGKNLGTWGEDPEHEHHWTASQFLRLVASDLVVERVLHPFPWVIALCRKPEHPLHP